MTDKERVKSLEKGLRLLVLLSRQDLPLSLDEITRLSGLKKTVCFRLLQTMKELNFVEQDPGTKNYRLGRQNISIGAAFDYAAFDEITPLMERLGIRGNEENYIAGATYRKEQYSFNATLNYSKNHMNDDQGIYFDALGAELYLHYDFTKNIRLAGGGNWMIPKDDDYEGQYSVRKGILSLQYTFGEATFDDLIYLEVAFPKGHFANGESRKTTVAIGLRYLFDLY